MNGTLPNMGNQLRCMSSADFPHLVKICFPVPEIWYRKVSLNWPWLHLKSPTCQLVISCPDLQIAHNWSDHTRTEWERDKETERGTDRQTDRQTGRERETERKREGQIDRQRRQRDATSVGASYVWFLKLMVGHFYSSLKKRSFFQIHGMIHAIWSQIRHHHFSPILTSVRSLPVNR